MEAVLRDPLLVHHVKTDKHTAGVGGATAREVRRHFWLLKADEASRELPRNFLTGGRLAGGAWRIRGARGRRFTLPVTVWHDSAHNPRQDFNFCICSERREAPTQHNTPLFPLFSLPLASRCGGINCLVACYDNFVRKHRGCGAASTFSDEIKVVNIVYRLRSSCLLRSPERDHFGFMLVWNFMKNTQMHIVAGGSVAEGEAEAACSSGSSPSQALLGPAGFWWVLLGPAGSFWVLVGPAGSWWSGGCTFHPLKLTQTFILTTSRQELSSGCSFQTCPVWITTCCALCYVPQAVLVKLLWCSSTNLQKVNWTVRVIFHGATLWI